MKGQAQGHGLAQGQDRGQAQNRGQAQDQAQNQDQGQFRTLRPSLKAALFFALSVPVALLIVTWLPDAWYMSLYLPGAALACLAADLLMVLPSRRLEAELRCPVRLFVGQSGTVTVSLRSTGGWAGPQRHTRIEALLEQKGEADAALPAAGRLAHKKDERNADNAHKNGSLQLSFTLTPRRRGQLEIVALWLRWRGPLGLVELRRRQPEGKKVDVIPDVRGIHESALRFFAQDAVYGSKSQRLKGEGAEFDTLCEYMPGMDNRFIDWKRSARHRKLLSKEFRQERNHQIILGFDTGHLMLEPVKGVPKLDHAITSGLLLAWVSLHCGDLAGACGFDLAFHSFLKPGRGLPWFNRFQSFTAGLAYSTEETNFTLGLAELNARLQRRALIVLFTEFIDTVSAELLLESLRWTARRHLVIFVSLRDPLPARLQAAPPTDFSTVARAVIADDFVRERAIVLERIARLGVHCLDVPAGELSTALLNRYLLIKQRGLL